jgi:hypothetical protein
MISISYLIIMVYDTMFFIADIIIYASGVPTNFVRGLGVQQIQLRTEDRENGDLGAVAS